MITHTFSFDIALSAARKSLQGEEPRTQLDVMEKVKSILESDLPQELLNLLRDIVDEQDISSQHKADYYNSFDISVVSGFVCMTFKPKTELVKMLEFGAMLGSATDNFLNSHKYKISKEGYAYKIIPLRTKDSGLEKPLEVRRFSATAHAEGGSVLRRVTVVLYENKESVPMEIMYADQDKIYYRSAPVSGTKKRIYVSSDRGRVVKSVDRFTQFRTISNKPGATRWKQPNIPGRHLADKAASVYSLFIQDFGSKLSDLVAREMRR